MIESNDDKKDTNDVVKLARERFKLSDEAFSNIRKLGLEDLKFRSGEQWPDDVVKERNTDGRPCLTINRIPQFTRQITNDQRQNRPSLKVSPVDDKADVQVAKVFEGLIRHIQYNSNADLARDNAFQGSVQNSFGYYRVVTDYCDKNSFEQEILIKKIENPFSVYVDPHSKEVDGSDMDWCIITEDISKSEYKQKYKNSELSQVNEWTSIGDKAPGWFSKDSCRIAEYFYKEYEDVTLIQLSTGEVYTKEELDQVTEMPMGVTIINTRKSKRPIIKWAVINGIEVLEETVWPGDWIPVLPVYGEVLNVDGERIYESLIRHAKDSQRMYNYWASSETETIALAPRAPYIVAEGQIEGYEHIWRVANRKNPVVLPYKIKSVDGNIIPAPQRNVYEPPVQAITQARSLASEDLKATTGIYDAALGARSNENSGIAIQRRNIQTQTSNFHFVDNLNHTMRHEGRILINLIPKVYDTARAVRILGESGDQEIVWINKIFNHNGKDVQYNLDTGKYDVVISTGATYETKRQEAAASMLELSKVAPQLMGVAPDLLIKNMDWPGADEIAERLKKTIDPNLIDDKKNQQVPPQAQAQMAQMNQMIEQLTEKLNEANEQTKTKKIELESKERIAFAQMEVDLKKELLKQQGAASNQVLAEELSMLRGRLNLLDINEDFDQQYNESELNEASGQQLSAMPEQQQPTDGISSGQITGE